MFCPNCSGFITESSLIKTKVKKWGNTDIEYDARCPLCSKHIGVMFWGRLTLTAELARKMEAQGRAEQISFGGRIESDLPTETPEPAEKPYMYPPPSGDDEDPFDDALLAEEAQDMAQPEEIHSNYKVLDDLGYDPLAMFTPNQLSGHYCPHCGQDLPNDVSLLPRRYRPK